MDILDDARVARITEKQRAFFLAGNTLPLRFRQEQLAKLKSAVLAREERFADALAKDLGKCRAESYFSEIGFVLAGISHAQKNLRKWMRPVRVRASATVFPAKNHIVRQPYGCALLIAPFNYPFQLALEPLAAALAAGNCAVLSLSELTPHTSAAVREMLGEIFPEEYVFCTEGGAENNAALLRARFDTIFFTGSARVGRIVQRAAAEHLTPVTLELGGKSPVIVDETAKLRVACERIAWGKFLNAGQTCVAPDYVFVQERVFAQFIEEMKGAIRRFYGEDARLSPDYGRIVNGRHTERLCALLREDGASVVYGGETDKAERFIAPTLLCPPDLDGAACMREEIFGPLLPVFPYARIEEALAFINAREKPLALYVFSEDKRAAEEILRRTSSGGACINDTVSHIIDPHLPFGGVGESGTGSYHGEYGFANFTHARSVLARSTRVCLRAAFPPFTEKKLRTVRRFMK